MMILSRLAVNEMNLFKLLLTWCVRPAQMPYKEESDQSLNCLH